jgi:hypothetical protein
MTELRPSARDRRGRLSPDVVEIDDAAELLRRYGARAAELLVPRGTAVKEHAAAGSLRDALGVAPEPLTLDECGERHPAVDAAERLRVVPLEPTQPRRPVARMETASRARVDGAFVDLLPQQIDFPRRTRVGPRNHTRRGAAVRVDPKEAVPEGGDTDGLDRRIGSLERRVDRVAERALDRGHRRLDAPVPCHAPPVPHVRALSERLQSAAVHRCADGRCPDVYGEYARHGIYYHREGARRWNRP